MMYNFSFTEVSLPTIGVSFLLKMPPFPPVYLDPLRQKPIFTLAKETLFVMPPPYSAPLEIET